MEQYILMLVGRSRESVLNPDRCQGDRQELELCQKETRRHVEYVDARRYRRVEQEKGNLF